MFGSLLSEGLVTFVPARSRDYVPRLRHASEDRNVFPQRQPPPPLLPLAVPSSVRGVRLRPDFQLGGIPKGVPRPCPLLHRQTSRLTVRRKRSGPGRRGRSREVRWGRRGSPGLTPKRTIEADKKKTPETSSRERKVRHWSLGPGRRRKPPPNRKERSRDVGTGPRR